MSRRTGSKPRIRATAPTTAAFAALVKNAAVPHLQRVEDAVGQAQAGISAAVAQAVREEFQRLLDEAAREWQDKIDALERSLATATEEIARQRERVHSAEASGRDTLARARADWELLRQSLADENKSMRARLAQVGRMVEQEERA
jgi:flagellar motility protein MotE (MotC chaperone)